MRVAILDSQQWWSNGRQGACASLGSVGGSSIVSHPRGRMAQLHRCHGGAGAMPGRTHSWGRTERMQKPQVCPTSGFCGCHWPQQQPRDTAGIYPCSRMRGWQVIFFWPATNCPLQSCARCRSWPSRHFSVPALMLVAATVHGEPCQEKSCTVMSTVWEEAVFPLPCPQKEDYIMKLRTIRWYGFKLPVPFSWGTREKERYEKSYVNHGYSRKEKQSAASLKNTGKTQYYQTAEFLHRKTMWTVISLWVNSLNGSSHFFMMKGQLEQRKWAVILYFHELAPPLPEIKVG